MILVNAKLGINTTLMENRINEVYLENTYQFRGFVEDMRNQVLLGCGDFFLSDKNKTIDLRKNSMLIIDPFELISAQSKLVATIYSRLEAKSIEEEYYLSRNNLIGEIDKYFNELLVDEEIPLKIDEQVDFIKLFKAVGLQIDTEYSDIVEEITTNLKVISNVMDKNIFFLINLKSYMTAEELKQFDKEAEYNGYTAVLVENKINELTNREVLIIDEDLCKVF